MFHALLSFRGQLTQQAYRQAHNIREKQHKFGYMHVRRKSYNLECSLANKEEEELVNNVLATLRKTRSRGSARLHTSLVDATVRPDALWLLYLYALKASLESEYRICIYAQEFNFPGQV